MVQVGAKIRGGRFYFGQQFLPAVHQIENVLKILAAQWVLRTAPGVGFQFAAEEVGRAEQTNAAATG
ncbi:hypothetical protein D3C73_1392440 [compost metagenome]